MDGTCADPDWPTVPKLVICTEFPASVFEEVQDSSTGSPVGVYAEGFGEIVTEQVGVGTAGGLHEFELLLQPLSQP